MHVISIHGFAGAGKTYALVCYAHRLASAGELVLFVQPSKLLIDNTMVSEVRKLAPRCPVRAIHGSVSEDVVKDIVTHMSSAVSGQGQIAVNRLGGAKPTVLAPTGPAKLILCLDDAE